MLINHSDNTAENNCTDSSIGLKKMCENVKNAHQDSLKQTWVSSFLLLSKNFSDTQFITTRDNVKQDIFTLQKLKRYK